jgi:hypothetical protein
MTLEGDGMAWSVGVIGIVFYAASYYFCHG